MKVKRHIETLIFNQTIYASASIWKNSRITLFIMANTLTNNNINLTRLWCFKTLMASLIDVYNGSAISYALLRKNRSSYKTIKLNLLQI